MRKLWQRIKNFQREILQRVREDKRAFFVFSVLFFIIVIILVQGVRGARWDRVFTGGLCLLLLFLPPLIEHTFSLQMPATLEISAYVFVFCAGVLGEIGDFYRRFAFWDTMLHAANGFLFAGFGFCLFSLFEKRRRVRTLPSPAYQSFTAFCFSETVGVLWEVFEFAADRFLHTDMQKDTLQGELHTVWLPAKNGGVVHVENIVSVEIKVANGTSFSLPGYLDVGLADTMWDLLVNLFGALAFCVIGYLYLKHQRGALAAQFIPRVRE